MLNRLQDVFGSLSRHEVWYVLIGGIAAVLHGVPRATFDLDVLIDPTPDNTKRLLAALAAAGLGTAALTSTEEVLSNEITVFKDRLRIDVRTATPGLSFADAWNRRVEMRYQGQAFFVASRADLIASKRASGRAVDLDDVRQLELANEAEDEGDPP